MYNSSIKTFLNEDQRSAFLFAHYDDEVQYVGLINHFRKKADFLWMTNNDGEAIKLKKTPTEIASSRFKEWENVIRILGIEKNNLKNLNASEIEIYDNFINWVAYPYLRTEIITYFESFARKIFDFLRINKPELVFIPAFQGGQPEHDLIAAFTGLSLKKLATNEDYKPLLVQLPQYEFIILIPLRFKPWYKGKVYKISISPEVLNLKIKVIMSYQSQQWLFDYFRQLINLFGKISSFYGRPFNIEKFLQTETFGPISFSFDFQKSPHFFDIFNYMDRHKGHFISFNKMIKPIITEIAGQIEKW